MVKIDPIGEQYSEDQFVPNGPDDAPLPTIEFCFPIGLDKDLTPATNCGIYFTLANGSYIFKNTRGVDNQAPISASARHWKM